MGVSEVITPVRRSLRFLEESNYVADNTVHDEETTPEKVNRLLKSHSYAYVPNKVNF
jgi:hypothetical protein